MIKFLLSFTVVIFSFIGHSQDVGYRTTDVGAEFQYASDFTSYKLHIGFNAEEHHSFILRGGYLKTLKQTTSAHNSEKGSGWEGSLGYRYHFSVVPKRFFIGAGIGIQSVNINWSAFLTEGSTKLLVLQPAIETGYTLVINDYMFITPVVAGILQTTINTKGDKVAYGSGFLPSAGISLGWRF